MEATVIAASVTHELLHWPAFTLDDNWFPDCWQIVCLNGTGFSEEYPTERLAMKRFRSLESKRAPGISGDSGG